MHTLHGHLLAGRWRPCPPGHTATRLVFSLDHAGHDVRLPGRAVGCYGASWPTSGACPSHEAAPPCPRRASPASASGRTQTAERWPSEMRNFVLLVIVGLLGWQGYQHFRSRSTPAAALHEPTGSAMPSVADTPTPTADFRCDGRIHCSQMTSCEEATFFLRNCPGVKMDGDNDGVPCEQQWCRK